MRILCRKNSVNLIISFGVRIGSDYGGLKLVKLESKRGGGDIKCSMTKLIKCTINRMMKYY